MATIVLHDELIDDSQNDNPVAGLTGTVSFKDRFKSRLSHLLECDIVISELQDTQISIYIAPKRGVIGSSVPCGVRIREFAKGIQDAMRAIAGSDDGVKRDEALNDQWDVILVYVSQSVHETIMALQKVFKEHERKLHMVVAQMCGLDDIDENGSSLDTDLGDRVIKLQGLANAYEGTMRHQNELIELSWKMIHECPAADVRLRCLLGSRFSIKVYDLVCRLGQPKNTHHTLARAAMAFSVFRTVSVHLGSPPPSRSRKVSLSPGAATSLQPVQQFPHNTSTSSICSKSPSPSDSRPQGGLMDIIRSYLPEADRGFSLLRLQPLSKQATALLVGCVLGDIPVPPGSDAYYLFGFVTCKDSKQEHDLTQYYRRVLKMASHPTAVFSDLMNALERASVYSLLRGKSHTEIEVKLPVLHKFLTTFSTERWSVFRLIQFLRDIENDEPLPCLKRDYGFKLCKQREEVTKLKVLYVKVLDNAGPSALHSACIHGRLLDFAVTTLGSVDPQMRRLLQNDYPCPAVGFDNAQGLDAYTTPLFKTSLKG